MVQEHRKQTDKVAEMLRKSKFLLYVLCSCYMKFYFCYMFHIYVIRFIIYLFIFIIYLYVYYMFF